MMHGYFGYNNYIWIENNVQYTPKKWNQPNDFLSTSTYAQFIQSGKTTNCFMDLWFR